MYKIEVNGVELAVEEQGRGEPIIFVPGGLSDYLPGYLRWSYFHGTTTPSPTADGTNFRMHQLSVAIVVHPRTQRTWRL